MFNYWKNSLCYSWCPNKQIRKGKKHYKMTNKVQPKRSEYSSPTTIIGKSNLQVMLVSKNIAYL